MINYVVYKSGTGEISHNGCCTPSVLLLQPVEAGESILEVDVQADNSTHYIDNGILTGKTNHPLSINKTTILADGIDECLITGIANPSTVTWSDGQQDEITDGEAGFSVDLPGAYKIKIASIKHFTEEITVEAIPAN